MNRLPRLFKEAKEVDQIENCEGITVDFKKLLDGEMTTTAIIEGPEDSLYKGGKFRVNVEIPERYPWEHPTITFQTKIFHPNIDIRGKICIDILNPNNWTPILTIYHTLAMVRSLLSFPNFDDPLRQDIASYNKKDFDSFAIQYTKEYAVL